MEFHSFSLVEGPLVCSSPKSAANRGYKTDGEGPARNTRGKMKRGGHGSELGISDFEMQSVKVVSSLQRSEEGDITPKRVTRSRKSRVLEDESEEEDKVIRTRRRAKK
mmetsp:Transcript_34805/g.25964  ORF Transcript_34805/g.25964 Transcript_34805/m.25964 type:complete len:108 (-) Transcript_34805:268-591(-)